ncbi:F-box protein [Aspergillus saccharolyticus JOP 1030-1]|uniref:F-box domain-containing protein n=1 Tax=Aspergillus saccharolyticus JOP 1030-1 TaxID=1450539 RepID=A0A318ZIK4_9EURO|nr:hypothetical protein BP01DRAFT_309079 [Aspergillus saccharolyticus JOP 1030-1]PYH40068.1 hypothetical protein BP01DRAFT_309079 [Aspergillus saccharolyticus JOP 1030-1]
MEQGQTATMLHKPDDVPVKDVVRIASYHRRDFDLAVVRTNPSDHDQIRSSLLSPNHATTSTLGQLDILPTELAHEICLYLDIRSLFRFRQVNRRAQQIVSSIRLYRAVINHALEAFCIILRTNIAPWFTLSDLFKVLCTKYCQFCGDFGGFIFLPSFARCCFTCIREENLPRVLPLSVLKQRLKPRSGRLLGFIPTVRTLPGIYSMDETPRKRRTKVVLRDSVNTLYLSDYSENTRVKRSQSTSLLPYMVTTSLPYFDPKSGAVQRGISCSGCQVALEKDLYTSGVKPAACALRDKVYSHDDFRNHFQNCHEARKLWELSGQGTSIINVPEFVRRRGYFKKRDVMMSFHSQ